VNNGRKCFPRSTCVRACVPVRGMRGFSTIIPFRGLMELPWRTYAFCLPVYTGRQDESLMSLDKASGR
jgi:hypothetical protein